MKLDKDMAEIKLLTKSENVEDETYLYTVDMKSEYFNLQHNTTLLIWILLAGVIAQLIISLNIAETS